MKIKSIIEVGTYFVKVYHTDLWSARSSLVGEKTKKKNFIVTVFIMVTRPISYDNYTCFYVSMISILA